MPHPLTKFELHENAEPLACWNIATIAIKQANAREILGQPHYIETDPQRTAGGTEDHWSFYSPKGIPAFFRMRVPYGTMDFCLTQQPIHVDDEKWLTELFYGFQIEIFANPIDENRHPNDVE
ncbi:MAG: hypothetical protein COA78_11525 [Blastopirellula sp.]|nr:MAG: hypothetical protein COA78_11525 [Blastopirellula sp.]